MHRNIRKALVAGALVTTALGTGVAEYFVSPPPTSAQIQQAKAIADNYAMGFDAGMDAAQNGSDYVAPRSAPCGKPWTTTLYGQGFCKGYNRVEFYGGKP